MNMDETMRDEILKPLIRTKAETKIILLVIDGLGGLPGNEAGQTELEAAHTPNMDYVAANSICGLHLPVYNGITSGSGPAHLGLFGYDPMEYRTGRGVLAALGVDFDLQPQDIAARGNFCTLDESGRITDRRAGRISTDKSAGLCRMLEKIDIPGVSIFVQPVKDYRFLLVLRGESLSADISDTDPQETGLSPKSPEGGTPEAEKTLKYVRMFLDRAEDILGDQYPANMVLLRGFSKRPEWPTINQRFGLKGLAVSGYPMYRGLSRLIGMDVAETGESLDQEFEALADQWDNFDYFYVHVKPVDSAGEDGDFGRKVRLLEALDEKIPRILELNPDVLILTGDHSTPSTMKSHSWHPVPVCLFSADCRPDEVKRFGERACLPGGLGPRFPAKDLMPLALANAHRLVKYGA